MRCYVTVGYADYVESEDSSTPSVYEPKIVEHKYHGFVLEDQRRWDSSQNVNDDTNISNRFNLIADRYFYGNFSKIRYVEWMGQKWKVHNIDASTRPRITITVSGLYHDELDTVLPGRKMV